jgi:SAM-dependent methyltransferase
MVNQFNWYQTFFNGLAIEMWHNAVPATYTEAEAQFVIEMTGLKPGQHILDVPCGSGRHTLALARSGYRVTGIDIAPGNIFMLDEAIGALPVQAVCADILVYPLSGSFHAAICLGNSFSYFPYPKMVQFLRKIHAVLVAKGRLIINTGVLAESILPNLKETNSMKVGDIQFDIENKYLEEDRLLHTEMRFTKGSEVEVKTAYHYVYTLDEINNMLREAGFEPVHVYNGISQTAYQAGDPQAYIVAEK